MELLEGIGGRGGVAGRDRREGGVGRRKLYRVDLRSIGNFPFAVCHFGKCRLLILW